MDSVHDLGGREGFGPIVGQHAPLFDDEWERRAMGVTMVSFRFGHNNGGTFRHSIERMDAAQYLTTRYHEHWFTGTATRLIEAGFLELGELEARAGGSVPMSRPVVAEPGEQPTPMTAEVSVGDRVRVRSWHPRGHTRCPGYVRGKNGTVVRLDPPSSLPDLEAHTDERRQEPQACVRFEAADLWGTGEGAAVHVDLWVSYLEPGDA